MRSVAEEGGPLLERPCPRRRVRAGRPLQGLTILLLRLRSQAGLWVWVLPTMGLAVHPLLSPLDGQDHRCLV